MVAPQPTYTPMPRLELHQAECLVEGCTFRAAACSLLSLTLSMRAHLQWHDRCAELRSVFSKD
jgi:hypothetical protein